MRNAIQDIFRVDSSNCDGPMLVGSSNIALDADFATRTLFGTQVRLR